jgi:hypothetical protein
MNRVHVKVPEIFLGVASSRRSLSRRIASLDRKGDRYALPAGESVVDRQRIDAVSGTCVSPFYFIFLLLIQWDFLSAGPH